MVWHNNASGHGSVRARVVVCACVGACCGVCLHARVCSVLRATATGNSIPRSLAQQSTPHMHARTRSTFLNNTLPAAGLERVLVVDRTCVEERKEVSRK